MPLEPPNVKYTIKLWINEERIPTKPFIMNTLGNLCWAFFDEYRDFPQSGLVDLRINPQNPPNSLVLLKVDETPIELKEFVQALLWRSLLGFISVLNKIPVQKDQLETADIHITLIRK